MDNERCEAGFPLKIQVPRQHGEAEQIIVNPAERDFYREFLDSASKDVQNAIDRLRKPISSFGPHGRRRSVREIRDIGRTRQALVNKYEAALDVLKGDVEKPIRMVISGEGEILGFQILEGSSPD